MNIKLESLSYKAQRYYMEIAYSLEGINGRPATQKEILDYLLTTLCDIEEIVGDPVTFIGENKQKTMPEQKMTYQERRQKVAEHLTRYVYEGQLNEVIAAQAEAIREVLKLFRAPVWTEQYLLEHGYIDPRSVTSTHNVESAETQHESARINKKCPYCRAEPYHTERGICEDCGGGDGHIFE